MKIIYLIVGLLIGAGASFFLAKSFYQRSSFTSVSGAKKGRSDSARITTSWTWSDSLDATKAAPNSHKVVYEDSAIRVLQVVLGANTTEPAHTHQWRSVMWFTQATPMVYYKYNKSGNQLRVQNSIPIPQMPAEVLNHGEALPAEEPHAIKNASSGTGIAYRVEFKKEFQR